MSLNHIYKYLEETNGFHKLYKIQFELDKIILDNPISQEEKILLDIEKAIWAIASELRKNKEEWMNKAFEIIHSDLDYLSSRADNAQNSVLKAIYSELLFHSNNDNYKKYINDSIDSYFQALKDFHKELKLDTERIFDVNDLIDKLLHLSSVSNSKKTKDIKTEIISILKDCSKLNVEYARLIKNIVKNMIEYKKIFKKKDFVDVDDIFWDTIKKLVREQDYRYVIDIIDLGLKIDDKIQKLSYPWLEEKCKCYEKMIKNEKDPMNSRRLCIDAIENYKVIDIISKRISNIERIYDSQKDKIIIPSHDYKAEVTECVKYADDILAKSPIHLLYHLANSSDLFPPKSLLEKRGGFLTERFFPCKIFLDGNSHPAKISTNEVLNDLYLSNYRISWSLYEYALQRILYEAIRTNKINLQLLINYLMSNSCFFDLQIKKSINRKYERYNWSSSIISILKTYFEEMQNYFEEPKKRYPHLIEITDSLVLKFEAFFRLYLESHKNVSIATSTKEPGVVREKDINYLLYDDFIIEKIGFDDLLFFRYLFIAKEGMNLRNDIAHSLLIPTQYTIEKFNLVFFAFLRLSKYNFPNTKRNKLKKHSR